MNFSELDLRDAFFDTVYDIARQDKDVLFLTADMGAFSLKRFKNDMPGQFINVGVAEQNMISTAAGLSLSGKRVFVYSIIPFVTLRCFEQIKIDLCCMNLPVTIVGIGAGVTYGGDGATHHGVHDLAVMRILPELTIINPSDALLTQESARMGYNNAGPTYVRIERGKLPQIYSAGADFSAGFNVLKKGGDITIIATGLMVHNALEIANILENESLSVGVVDLFRIKPIEKERLLPVVKASGNIVTLEENSIVGGVGTMVSEFMVENNVAKNLKKLAMHDRHYFPACSREAIHAFCELDADSASKTILKWHKGL